MGTEIWRKMRSIVAKRLPIVTPDSAGIWGENSDATIPQGISNERGGFGFWRFLAESLFAYFSPRFTEPGVTIGGRFATISRSRKIRVPVLFFILYFLFFISVPAIAELVPEKIYLLANAAEPESVELAQFYCEQRGVPAENILAFEMPKNETISWNDFAEKIYAPLLENLIERGLLKNVVPAKKLAVDYFQKFVPAGTQIALDDVAIGAKIDCLVICRGVPLRIANDEKLLAPLPENSVTADEKSVPAGEKSVPANPPKRSPLDVNCASVDSELAMLAVAGTKISGPSKNPYFADFNVPAMQKLVVRIARIDGPSHDAAKRIISRSIEAEKMGGPAGRAYIDRGGPFPQGDKWFDETAEILRILGYDLTIEKTKFLLNQRSRYDAPAFYFGWYTRHASGFVEDPNFYFPAGAIAFHLHSFSATSLRDKREWCAALIDRGAAATFGNVFEPYLEFSIRPQILMSELAAGKQLGEAAFTATPALSWQAIIVGDPLYRPFEKDLKKQLYNQQMQAKIYSFPQAQYIFLRTINFANASGDSRKADVVERELKLFAPGLAGTFFVAQKNCGDAARTTWIGPSVVQMRSENVGLLLDVARWLAAHDRKPEAAKIFDEVLLRSRDGLLPKNRKLILEEAVKLIRENNLTGTHINDWQRELDRAKQ